MTDTYSPLSSSSSTSSSTSTSTSSPFLALPLLSSLPHFPPPLPPAYVSKPSDGSKAKTVIFVTDIFGYELVNVRLLADEYAAQGLYCLIPDILEGGSLVARRW